MSEVGCALEEGRLCRRTSASIDDGDLEGKLGLEREIGVFPVKLRLGVVNFDEDIPFQNAFADTALAVKLLEGQKQFQAEDPRESHSFENAYVPLMNHVVPEEREGQKRGFAGIGRRSDFVDGYPHEPDTEVLVPGPDAEGKGHVFPGRDRGCRDGLDGRFGPEGGDDENKHDGKDKEKKQKPDSTHAEATFMVSLPSVDQGPGSFDVIVNRSSGTVKNAPVRQDGARIPMVVACTCQE